MTAEPNDVLGREVSIRAHLEDKGLTVSAKSRALAAIDRLVGSVFDLPAAIFEGMADKRRMKARILRELREVQLEAAKRRLADDPNAGDGLLLDALEEHARKLGNAAGVAVEAVDALRLLDYSASDTGQPPSEDPPGEIDPDWMNQFSRYAEDATSDDLQQLWGRVLAGEIRKPGAFSRHTLRFISELDKSTAEHCEELAKHVLRDFVPDIEHWHSGPPLNMMLELQQLGLLEGVASFGLSKTFTIDERGVAILTGRKLGLIIRGEVGVQNQVKAILLTRVGKEVISLLDFGDEEPRLREFADSYEKAGLKSIWLANKIVQPGGGWLLHPTTLIWGESNEESAGA